MMTIHTFAEAIGWLTIGGAAICTVGYVAMFVWAALDGWRPQ